MGGAVADCILRARTRLEEMETVLEVEVRRRRRIRRRRRGRASLIKSNNP